jgi:DNA-binding transcriptional MerR regulator
MSDEHATFPIRTVERLTGLTAATIRAWERRYEAIEPARTEGGARRYTAENVRRLVLLREAIERGHSIAQVAELDDDALAALSDVPSEATKRATSTEPSRTSPLVDDYLALIGRFDTRAALDLLARAATLTPPRQLVFEVIVPLVRETGERWARGELGIAQEHVVTAQLEWLLATLVRSASDRRAALRAVVATPPDERHGLGALIGAFILAWRGIEPIYLGPDLPYEEIARAARAIRASLVVLSVVADRDPTERRALARGIQKIAKTSEVWIGARRDHPITKSRLAARLFHDYETFELAAREHTSPK